MKKKVIVFLAGIMVLFAGTQVFFFVENVKNAKVLENEINEVKQYYGIQSLSQLSTEYYYKDAAYSRGNDKNIDNSAQMSNFWMCYQNGKDAALRLASRENGAICLEQVVYKADKDIIFYLHYNTETDKYYIKTYDECIKEQNTYIDESNMQWKYTDVYLIKNTRNVFLYRTESPNLTFGVGYNFVKVVKENYNGESDVSKIDLLFEGDSANQVTDKLNVFLDNRNSVGYVWEYRYVYTQLDQICICSLCHSGGKYYHITYNASTNEFTILEYMNLWKKDANGKVEYILSNLSEDAKYVANNVFSNEIMDYLYLKSVK